MTHALILQHHNITSCNLEILKPFHLPTPASTPYGFRFIVSSNFSLPDDIKTALHRQEIDFAILPDMAFSDLGLIVSDMDSTLITIECIDEIAAQAHLKKQVAEITEHAMRGELDFEQSLRQRVALLKGLNESALQKVYNSALQLSPGAEFLLQECKKHHIKFMLVSGGFTFFTQQLQQKWALEYQYANTLEIKNGKLTGELLNPIIDAQAKADLLKSHQKQLSLDSMQVLAMGDGANDIPMLQAAGIGVAYKAKQKTQAHADACIHFGGLERIRGWFR